MIEQKSTTLKPRVRRTINLLCFWLLVGWILYAAAGTNLLGELAWPNSVDYRIIYTMSRRIVHDHHYGNSLFPYPPSAVVLLYSTTWLPMSGAAAAWLVLTVLATLGTAVTATSLVGLSGHPWRWPVAVAGFAVAEYYILWDLRSQNINMVCCFLLVAGLAALKVRRDWLAGMLLAGSITLKLYPVLTLPYLFWIGKRRAFAATIVFLAIFFGVLPLAVFHPDGLVTAYASWFEQLRLMASKMTRETFHPILIALPFTLIKTLPAGSSLVPWLVGSASAVWLGAITACVFTGRRRENARVEGWDLAVDGGILAVALIPISPYLEPYHPVAIVLPVLALLQRATDSPYAAIRWTVGVALGAGWLVLQLTTQITIPELPLGYRGVGVFIQMLSVVLALALVRRIEAARRLDLAGPGPEAMDLRAKQH
jgi:hypothetical protein